MSPKRPFGLTDWLLLLLVLAAAAGGRVYYLLNVADGARSAGPLVVQEAPPKLVLPKGTVLHGQADPNELDALVHNLKDHRWFGSLAPFAAVEEKTAHVSPGYPWLLAWIAGAVPAEEFGSLVRWGQCGLGVLTVGCYFLFARRVFESRLVAVLAGLLTAVHPYWIINTAALNDGTLTAFLLALVLLLSSFAGKSGGTLVSLLFGLSLAGLALVRAPLLPFAFIALLWLLWRSRHLETGWMCALLAFLGFFIGLGPWAFRNYLTYQEALPLVDSTHYHLWMGNNPQATGGPLSEQQLLQALVDVRRSNLNAVRTELAEMPQPSRYRKLAPYVLHQVRTHPKDTVFRRLSAACFFFASERLTQRSEVAEVQLVEGTETPEWIAEWAAPALLISLGLMLGLSLLAWRWTYPWRDRCMVATLALVWVPLPYILGHAAHLHGPRMPLDGILLTYAAFVLACLWPATGQSLFAGPEKTP